MTTQSNNSSTSHAAGSPITPSHPHRYHHAAGSRISHLSRETSADSIQSLPPVSNFLQERLQRERKIESERLVAQASNDMMSASLDLRTVQSSPPRGPPSEGRRPMSSGSRGEATKKKGLGLKEMEQVSFRQSPGVHRYPHTPLPEWKALSCLTPKAPGRFDAP